MWHTTYNRQFLADPGQNDAAAYGVTIKRAPAAAMRCIGVHHLTSPENRGNHHVYLDVLDEDGERLTGAIVLYTWQGRQGDPLQVICDKPANEPAANIPLYPGQVVTLWVDTGQLSGASDQVSGIHTAHPDEDTGNTRYHHSFYVVFQLRTAQTPPIPTASEQVTPPPAIPEQPIPLGSILPDLFERLNRIHQDALYIMETLQKL
ncbi:MAG: hypothetical protein ACP5R2_06645 [Anaerolineae bacterium]